MLRRFFFLFVALAGVSCGSSSETTTGPSQIRCAVQVQGDGASFSADGGVGSVRITTSRECTWSARSDSAWVALTSQVTGQGDGAVAFRVAANADPSSRAAAVLVEDARVQISQAGRPCTFGLSSTTERVDAGGGDRTVQISASSSQCRWTAFTDAAWISIMSLREGTGSGAVTFRVEPLAGATRTGAVTIAGDVVRVEQGTASGPGPGPGPNPNCSYVLGTQALGFEQTGGVREVTVTTSAGCAWSASTSSDWIAILGGQSGSGPGAVRITVAANPGAARNAILRIADQTVAISQGSGCSISLNPVSVSVAAAAGSGVVQVTAGAGCAWAATSAAAWIAITEGANGSGNGQVRFSIAANAGPARDGGIAIGGRTFTVAQASGCTYSIAPTTQGVAGGGGSGTASITTAAGCAWTAASNAEWIALASRSGVGPGQVAFTVSPNPGPARNGTFTLAGQVFTVNQSSPCQWVFSPPSHHYEPGGGNGAILVIVTGPCTWTAASDVSWITLTSGASGTGNGLVQFVVAPNVGAARAGSLTIAGQRYEVTQGGS